ncbi:hypothetical protein LSUB1_G005546 [Lachnellula subtilissima]|uniref:Protein kinase domain-containing protein n=1 Tax=Lachnellula subtilissima TaxID=602034 RepID=A0A8H8RP24_9HELO|nr:hypothetical protein LSUB1_G005546 [Lachnellula subtilissima]
MSHTSVPSASTMHVDSSQSEVMLNPQVMDSHFELEGSWITVMCRAFRFQINVSLSDLRGSCFEATYSELVEKVDGVDGGDDDDYEAIPYPRFFPGVLLPTNLPSQTLVSGSTLQPHSQPTRDAKTLNPFALMTPSKDFPPYPQVPHTEASDAVIPAATETYDYMSEIPQRAVLSDSSTMFFKPAIDKTQITREIITHLRLVAAGLVDKIRVSNLHSIVISTDSTMMLGLLFHLIPPHPLGENLGSLKSKAASPSFSTSQYLAKWKAQVTATITQLHAHDIVWGDAHPGNIVIDAASDAWIVDFGGGWVEGFVERKKAGTKEGDWQGVGNIFGKCAGVVGSEFGDVEGGGVEDVSTELVQ